MKEEREEKIYKSLMLVVITVIITFLCPVPYVHKVGIKGKNQKFPRLRKV